MGNAHHKLIDATALPSDIKHLLRSIADVQPDTDTIRELITHFEDGLASGKTANDLIEAFGDPQLAASALRSSVERKRFGKAGARGLTMFDRLTQTLKYSFRRLASNPGFTATAVVSLAIGIGANTAMFSLVNGILLKGSPYQEPGSLVAIFESDEETEFNVMSYPDIVDVREATGEVFSGVAAARFAPVQVETGGDIALRTAEIVNGNMFEVLGIGARVGRTLTSEDDITPGAHPVVALSNAFWASEFDSDPAVIGQDLRINARSYEIVGVVDPEFKGVVLGIQADIYAPMMMTNELLGGSYDVLSARNSHSNFTKARLLPGVTLAEAQTVLDNLAADLHVREPDSWQGNDGLNVIPQNEIVMYPPIDRFLVPATGILMGLVGIVLLIACANLASFLLARALDRRREISIRMAVGATRGVLIRQLIAESVVLSGLGALVGFGLGRVALRFLMSLNLPIPVNIKIDTSLDPTIMAFTVGVTLLAGIAFGLAPAIQATNADIAGILRDEAAKGSGKGKVSLRGTLVAGQVALSLVLLVSAGLFVRSLLNTASVDPGFGSKPAAILSVVIDGRRFPDGQEVQQIEQLERVFREVPGVIAIGAVDDLPLDQSNNQTTGLAIAGHEPPPGRDYILIDYARIAGDFFEATGIELVDGRGFRPTDDENSAGVAIVTQAFVDRFWPGEEAVGRTFMDQEREVRVVGVTRDVKIRSLGEAPRPMVFYPIAQSPSAFVTYVAATNGDPDLLSQELMAAGRGLDPDLLVWQRSTIEEHIGRMLVGARIGAGLLGTFALIALILASVGLYGVVGYAVAQRTREVGIRMSLGAEGGEVVRMLMSSGIKLVAIGGGVGLILSLVLTRLFSRFLFGVPPLDPITFSLVPTVFLAIAAIAAYLPARRASSVDPVEALRSEG